MPLPCAPQLQRELAAATGAAGARAAQVAELQAAALEAEVAAGLAAREQQAQISTLQKEMIKWVCGGWWGPPAGAGA